MIASIWLSGSCRVHQFVVGRGSAPNPAGGAPSDPLACLKRALLPRGSRESEWKIMKEVVDGKGWDGMGGIKVTT